jgi:hypothetical protein
MQATQELQKTRDLNDYQCVELDGILATDEAAFKFRKYFDLHLQPAHNNDRKHHPNEGSGETRSWWQRAGDRVNGARNGLDDGDKDLGDLWDEKTGKMTERGKEILGPIAGRNIHVNTIVAHSWGAVLLQNAIRTGVVSPPKKIIVVGLPDADLEKWKALAQYTGTDVIILANPLDMAVAAAKVRDALRDMDIIGAGKRYDEGRIANEWQRWQAANEGGNPLKLEGVLKTKTVNMGISDTGGHGRNHYYQVLVAEGELSRTADEMKQDQENTLDERFQELREQDIETETQNVYTARVTAEGGQELEEKLAEAEHRRQGMDDGAARNRQQEQERELAAATLRGGAEIAQQRSWQLAQDLRTLSLDACKSPQSIADSDVAGVKEIETAINYQYEDRLSAEMSGCEKGVFDRIVELARSRRLGSGLTPDFVRMLGAYYAPPKPRTPVYNQLPEQTRRERAEKSKDPCRDNGNKYCP